jgi:hypothetical protein
MRKTIAVVIDDEVPLPKTYGPNSESIHPLIHLLSQLEVNQSFIWPAMAKENLKLLQSRSHSYGNRCGKKFASRMVTVKRGKPSMRFWRTA